MWRRNRFNFYVEGEREPTPKTSFPIRKGYWGKPTTVNNVETLNNIPSIFLQGLRFFPNWEQKNQRAQKICFGRKN